MAEYCACDVKNTFDLFNYFSPQLDVEGVRGDYEKIETEFVKVLTNMEYRGVKVDKSWLEMQKEKAELELKKMEKSIQAHTGTDVNIHSNKQLNQFLLP